MQRTRLLKRVDEILQLKKATEICVKCGKEVEFDKVKQQSLDHQEGIYIMSKLKYRFRFVCGECALHKLKIKCAYCDTKIKYGEYKAYIKDGKTFQKGFEIPLHWIEYCCSDRKECERRMQATFETKLSCKT